MKAPFDTTIEGSNSKIWQYLLPTAGVVIDHRHLGIRGGAGQSSSIVEAPGRLEQHIDAGRLVDQFVDVGAFVGQNHGAQQIILKDHRPRTLSNNHFRYFAVSSQNCDLSFARKSGRMLAQPRITVKGSGFNSSGRDLNPHRVRLVGGPPLDHLKCKSVRVAEVERLASGIDS